MPNGQQSESPAEDLPCLTEITDWHEEAVIPIREGRTVFGRHPTSDVLLTSLLIGTRVAIFDRKGNGVWIEDVGARGGIHVDENRVDTRELLKDGAVVKLGPYEFRYRSCGADS